ncbi:MAG TPA: hypothetical protein ENK35_07395 [Candidatus Tenderia sp.]|nr:hypothetical protein [Candidatus Tenderia sp.]
MNRLIPKLQSWPLGGINSETGRYPYAEGDTSLRESMINILLTRPGERLMRPEFGAGLQNFIHQPNNVTTRQLIADSVNRALKRWEPRIVLESVNVMAEEHNLSEVIIEIHYRSLISDETGALGLRLNLTP